MCNFIEISVKLNLPSFCAIVLPEITESYLFIKEFGDHFPELTKQRSKCELIMYKIAVFKHANS